MAETYHPRGELVDGFAPREHPIYVVWASMKVRCSNPKAANYENYGGRGITYCDRWKHFANFAADMFSEYEPGLTIERKDNSKGYSPDNCIWADRTTQQHNRRKFKNNTTGATGIVKTKGGNFEARYDHEKIRYPLGAFPSFAEAVRARNHFIRGFHEGDASVFKLTERRARLDSSVGVRGVTRGPDGFLVRRTVDGERRYYGLVQTIEEAKILLRANGHDC